MSQKEAAIGIDLGTTYSCAAVWFNKKNRVEIIPNEQGNKITPSCVAFTDTEVLVGDGAKNQITKNPTNTVFDVKRLIGNRFQDTQVQKDMELLPFKIIEGCEEKPTIVVEFMGEEKNLNEELSAMSVIIPRNTSIHTSTKKVFCSPVGVTSLNISVYQGENKYIKDNMLLSQFNFYDLTRAPNGKSQIEVCFSLAVNGILQVYAEDTAPGRRKSITIVNS